MAQLNLSYMPHYEKWETFARTHMSVLKLYLLYAVPLSMVPPGMLYYSGVEYGGQFLLPALSDVQLQTIGIVFFIAELVMTFVLAYIIQHLGELVDIKPDFEDAYKLAVIAPTPLWLAPLFFFIPSLMLNLAVGSVALILSGVLIYYCVPSILKVEEKGHATLLSGSILAAGMVAWIVMLHLTLLSWGFVTYTLPLLM